ncbi:hypothetical protein PQX77_003453 [Marasmius sp. AFHP31]|nr:hypothetical protein PQX77_003453 [Marasmius sp. AFHP31]
MARPPEAVKLAMGHLYTAILFGHIDEGEKRENGYDTIYIKKMSDLGFKDVLSIYLDHNEDLAMRLSAVNTRIPRPLPAYTLQFLMDESLWPEDGSVEKHPI